MSDFPASDVKDKIIHEMARLIRDHHDSHRFGSGKESQWLSLPDFFEIAAALNSYGDTLIAEEILLILKSLPRRKAR